jgi:hypothetical protein
MMPARSNSGLGTCIISSQPRNKTSTSLKRTS